MTPAMVLAALWVVWLGSWLLASRWTATTVVQQSGGSRLLQSLPIWAGAYLFVHPPPGLASHPFGDAVATGWFAVVLAAAGFVFTWWARVHLGRLWSAAVALKADHTLVRSGPYAITRHPIYTGLLCSLLATSVALDSTAAIVGFACMSLGFFLKSRQEEQFLRDRFGSAYDEYRRDVPALVPGLRI